MNLLVYFFILTSLVTSAFMLNLKNLKDLNKTATQISESNKLQNCTTFLQSITSNKNVLDKIVSVASYNSLTSSNENLKYLIKTKGLSSKISDKSAILESIDFTLPVFTRDVKDTATPNFSSAFGIFLQRRPEDFFMLIDPFRLVVIKSKFVASNDRDNPQRISIKIEKQPLIISFPFSNYNISNTELITNSFGWLVSINDYLIVYLNDQNNLEYRSLLTNDAQPACRGIGKFIKLNETECVISSSKMSLEKKVSCINENSSPFDRVEALLRWM